MSSKQESSTADVTPGSRAGSRAGTTETDTAPADAPAGGASPGGASPGGASSGGASSGTSTSGGTSSDTTSSDPSSDTPSSDGASADRLPSSRRPASSSSKPTAGKRADRAPAHAGTKSQKPAAPQPSRHAAETSDSRPKASRGDKAKAAVGAIGEGSNRLRNLIASIVWLVAVLAAVVLALGALLYALDAANPDNGVVQFFIGIGKRLVGPFANVFEFGKGESGKEHLVNWGLAAVVYLIIGKVLDRIIRPSK